MNYLPIGTIVKHFKHEMCSLEDQCQNRYIYRIEGYARDADSEDIVVVYRAMYPPFQLWIRKVSEFYRSVDTTKYPDIHQDWIYEEVIASGLPEIVTLPSTRSTRESDKAILAKVDTATAVDSDPLPFC